MLLKYDPFPTSTTGFRETPHLAAMGCACEWIPSSEPSFHQRKFSSLCATQLHMRFDRIWENSLFAVIALHLGNAAHRKVSCPRRASWCEGLCFIKTAGFLDNPYTHRADHCHVARPTRHATIRTGEARKG